MTPQPPPLNDEERDDLVAYLDGELKGARADEVEAKISRDPAIRAEAETLKKTWELLDYLPKPEPTPSFTHRTLDRLAALRPTGPQPIPTRRRWGLALLGWAAALLIATVVGYAGVQLAFPPDRTDEELARDLRVLENFSLYETVEDMEFLRGLDHPDLFGDDPSGG